MAGLTTKQEAFVWAYIGPAGFNASEAVRIAGYKTKNPDVLGYQLRNTSYIRERIDEVLAQIAGSAQESLYLVWQDATRSDRDILRLASQASDDAGVPAGASTISALVSSRTTARASLLKAHGLLTDRLNVKHSGRVDHVHRIPQSLHALTDDELDALEIIATKALAAEHEVPA